jgi:CheY-like chemotaxis protein
MDKVLVIEDNKDSLKLISYALKRSGYEVVSAETGHDGIKLATTIIPHFIIMDIGLPDIDGIEATRQIKNAETCCNIPIIAITSYAMTGDRDRILAAGCVGYFEKPIDPLTIVEQIHRMIGQKGP